VAAKAYIRICILAVKTLAVKTFDMKGAYWIKRGILDRMSTKLVFQCFCKTPS
jgi:hypothetical protein